MIPAAATLVVILATNSVGEEPIGTWDGAGDAAHDGFFRYDDTIEGEVWQSFRLRNEGDAGEVFSVFALDWDFDSCGAAVDLAPGEDCEIRSTYDAAKSVEGYMEAEFVVHSDDEERPELSIVVSAKKQGEGCNTAGPGGSFWLLGLALFGLRRRLGTNRDPR